MNSCHDINMEHQIIDVLINDILNGRIVRGEGRTI